MTRHSATPSAHIHSDARDAQRFPERVRSKNTNNEPVVARTDFPATGTPNAVLHGNEAPLEIERSEQVTKAGRTVPTTDAWQGFEEEQQDWLDKDAAR